MLPADASAEDVDVDVALLFLDGFVAQALQNGAAPYIPGAPDRWGVFCNHFSISGTPVHRLIVQETKGVLMYPIDVPHPVNLYRQCRYDVPRPWIERPESAGPVPGGIPPEEAEGCVCTGGAAPSPAGLLLCALRSTCFGQPAFKGNSAKG